jgi:hypothetical protein
MRNPLPRPRRYFVADKPGVTIVFPTLYAFRVEIGCNCPAEPKEFTDREQGIFCSYRPTLTADEIRLQSALTGDTVCLS